MASEQATEAVEPALGTIEKDSALEAVEPALGTIEKDSDLEAVEPALGTIEKDSAAAMDDGVVDANIIADPVPLKIRTTTSVSICSVATEQGEGETRDATAIKSRGTDGSRDGIESGGSIMSSSVMEYGQSTAGSKGLPATDNSVRSVSLIEQFYSSVELGAARVFSCCAFSSSEAKPDISEDELLSASASTEGQKNKAHPEQQEQSVTKVKSQESISYPGSPLSHLKKITSDEVHILDTFSDEITFDSEHQKSISNYVTPKAQNLLNEIKDMENNFLEVRKTMSKEKVGQLEKRQDPYMKQMATIKQHLQEQQALLQSAPEETKKDYYRAISRAAILNAEVQTRRAELELKKIKLESMIVEDEMDRMINGDEGTFYSMDERSLMSKESRSLMSKESEDRMDRAFDVFARFTADKFNKIRKNKARKGQAVAE